ncbi:tRNA (adenosine(37)-N6)-dimethylallyltransferase MiaA [Camelliibacillus cellulosilyticus]|uniref:tRNA dimethylallyltransferase n=1 Tax=Camelliibacillus cellulosilyticus TaxID=2174486 RepID=A0ABV9GJT1_9BACL
MKTKLVAIVGPTAVGKTALGVALAKALDGEVINGDASQVYKGMDIGTAKITADETEGVPHYLIDIVSPEQTYTAFDFQTDARRQIADISARGKLPIIVGGTGLYIKAATYDYRFADEPETNQSMREAYQTLASLEGPAALHERLRSVDPGAAEAIHPNNIKRVIRALEKYETTGLRAEERDEQTAGPLYDLVTVGLTMDRDKLYQRINDRVDQMVAAGLEKEARALYDRGLFERTALQSIGYKEWLGYFTGAMSFAETVDLIKKHTRRFAKRQYTWFNHQMDVKWFDISHPSDRSQNFSKIIQFVAGKLEERSK